MKTAAYAAGSATTPLGHTTIERREPGPKDVLIEITHCGVCHSDLHQARNEWSGTTYPIVPGHEIVGRVLKHGGGVTRYKAGDVVGVGCMVGSCRTCTSCQAGLEQYCLGGTTFTYNSADPISGGQTYGGYSTHVVVDESFVLRIPKGLDPAKAAPLLCAGITTYSPLRHWKVREGQRVGIVGIGGLGHMGIKLARALGAHVVVFTTSAKKREDALRLGAHEVVVSTDAAAMAQRAKTLDFVLDCVSAEHDVNAYLQLLRLDGTMVLVGAPEKPLEVEAFNLLMPRRSFAGSGIGGIAETQEMLDFCGERGIGSEIELITMDKINDAYERLLEGDVRYRFVIDMASLK